MRATSYFQRVVMNDADNRYEIGHENISYDLISKTINISVTEEISIDFWRALEHFLHNKSNIQLSQYQGQSETFSVTFLDAKAMNHEAVYSNNGDSITHNLGFVYRAHVFMSEGAHNTHVANTDVVLAKLVQDVKTN